MVACTYLGRETLQRHRPRIRVRLTTEVTRRRGSELWQRASTALDPFGTVSDCGFETGEGILWEYSGGLEGEKGGSELTPGSRQEASGTYAAVTPAF